MDEKFENQPWKRRSIQIEKPKSFDASPSGGGAAGLSLFYKVLLALSVLLVAGAIAFFIFSDPFKGMV